MTNRQLQATVTERRGGHVFVETERGDRYGYDAYGEPGDKVIITVDEEETVVDWKPASQRQVMSGRQMAKGETMEAHVFWTKDSNQLVMFDKALREQDHRPDARNNSAKCVGDGECYLVNSDPAGFAEFAAEYGCYVEWQ